jgi:pimeloyl-ACP methyl ester carboxylesterase
MAGGGARRSFVLVHGAWHGGWCWRDVADLLRAGGHRVTTPTQTGLGERRHLMSRDITLDTFVADILNHIEAEELEDVVLVGHSHAGGVISGVADRIPARLRQLVYLDAAIPERGRSAFGMLPEEIVAARRKLVAEQGQGVFIPAPPVTAFGIPEDHPQAAWVARRLTPHPVGTYESPLVLANPVGNGLPCTYIACTAPLYAPIESTRRWVRQQAGWRWLEIASGHDAMVLHPAELSAMLMRLA